MHNYILAIMEKNECLSCQVFHKVLGDKGDEIKVLEAKIQTLTRKLKEYESKTKYCELCCFATNENTVKNENTQPQENNFSNIIENLASETHIKQENVKDYPYAGNENLDKESNIESQSFSDNSIINNENVNNQQNSEEYIYDERCKMYFCVSTGYYYDKVSGLFYVPEKQAYYRYDYEKCVYELVKDDNSKQAESLCEMVTDKVCNLNLDEDSSNETIKSASDQVILTGYEAVDENDKSCDIVDEKSNDWNLPEGSNMSVRDLVREVAEQNFGMSDYIYDSQSKKYYSPSTGYYFDSVQKLLFDPQSGVYYKYDEDKCEYEFYYQIDVKKQEDLMQLKKNKQKMKDRKNFWKKKQEIGEEKLSDDIALDNYQHEVVLVDNEENYSSPEEGELFTSDSESDESKLTEDIPSFENLYYPCIRAIVKNSAVLKTGSLFLIPYPGTVLGRDQSSAVCVGDNSVSKIHAEIKFCTESWKYSIEDLGSQNGTYINDNRLSEAKEKSSSHILNHGDILKLGSCSLLLHIHTGHDTCDKCEPGQVIAENQPQENKKEIIIKSKEEREKERKKENKRIKSKYGLKGMEYKTVKNNSKYEDKAEIRRQTVGSQCPFEKTESTSMDMDISETNIGYKMLKKLGWNKGESLGTSGTGISEPVSIRPLVSRAGLGYAKSPSTPQPPTQKSMRWVKAQQRYSQLK